MVVYRGAGLVLEVVKDGFETYRGVPAEHLKQVVYPNIKDAGLL